MAQGLSGWFSQHRRFREKDLAKAQEVIEMDDLMTKLFRVIKKELIALIQKTLENGERP